MDDHAFGPFTVNAFATDGSLQWIWFAMRTHSMATRVVRAMHNLMCERNGMSGMLWAAL